MEKKVILKFDGFELEVELFDTVIAGKFTVIQGTDDKRLIYPASLVNPKGRLTWKIVPKTSEIRRQQ